MGKKNNLPFALCHSRDELQEPSLALSVQASENCSHLSPPPWKSKVTQADDMFESYNTHKKAKKPRHDSVAAQLSCLAQDCSAQPGTFSAECTVKQLQQELNAFRGIIILTVKI